MLYYYSFALAKAFQLRNRLRPYPNISIGKNRQKIRDSCGYPHIISYAPKYVLSIVMLRTYFGASDKILYAAVMLI